MKSHKISTFIAFVCLMMAFYYALFVFDRQMTIIFCVLAIFWGILAGIMDKKEKKIVRDLQTNKVIEEIQNGD